MSTLVVVVVVAGFLSACLLFVLALCKAAARPTPRSRENGLERAEERRVQAELYGRRWRR